MKDSPLKDRLLDFLETIPPYVTITVCGGSIAALCVLFWVFPRYTEFRGIRLDEKWDGKTFTPFLSFDKPEVLTNNLGNVHTIVSTSKTDSLKEAVAALENQLGKKMEMVTNRYGEAHYYLVGRTGNLFSARRDSLESVTVFLTKYENQDDYWDWHSRRVGKEWGQMFEKIQREVEAEKNK